MSLLAKPKRNHAIVQEYRAGGISMHALGEKHGISCSRVHYILKAHGALPSPDTRRRNQIAALNAFWSDPARSEGLRRRYGRMAEKNKPALVWPDCPDHLRADYETLRQVYPARIAKAKLLGSAA